MRRWLVIAGAAMSVCAALAGTAMAATPVYTATGNVLVLLARDRAAAAAGRAALAATIARVGARRAGFDVPQIGLVTLRPPGGVTPAAFAAAVGKLGGVASAQVEHRLVPRAVPDDPALSVPDQYSGTLEWTLAREGFYDAWNISRGAGHS